MASTTGSAATPETLSLEALGGGFAIGKQGADMELCRRIANADGAAFKQLMRRCNRMLFRTARAILRGDAAAEHAVQDAWLRAYRSIGTFRGEAKLSTWLVRIVVNEALARRRKAARGGIVPIADGASEERELESPAGPCERDGPAQIAERRDLQRVLEAKIGALSEPLRAVFLLRALEEFSVAEMAQALGLREATVRTRFFRARGHLRNALS
ncbi:MAG TPA: RNA polymerase sigma factor [Burkholderiales bacterium]|nr:RNA polymerase sigma factor [Burkholderiales bacterium]